MTSSTRSTHDAENGEGETRLFALNVNLRCGLQAFCDCGKNAALFIPCEPRIFPEFCQ